MNHFFVRDFTLLYSYILSHIHKGRSISTIWRCVMLVLITPTWLSRDICLNQSHVYVEKWRDYLLFLFLLDVYVKIIN